MEKNNLKPDEELPEDETVLDTTLVPHRSLSPRGVIIILCCVSCVSFAVSLPFFFMGAWPVAGFFGLDVFLLYIAFRASMKSARSYEQIVITHVDLLLRKVSAKGREQLWHFNPSWTRLKMDEHEEFGIERIALVQGRKEVEIGGFLGADEKAEFAGKFKSALAEAKSGRVYNP